MLNQLSAHYMQKIFVSSFLYPSWKTRCEKTNKQCPEVFRSQGPVIVHHCQGSLGHINTTEALL